MPLRTLLLALYLCPLGVLQQPHQPSQTAAASDPLAVGCLFLRQISSSPSPKKRRQLRRSRGRLWWKRKRKSLSLQLCMRSSAPTREAAPSSSGVRPALRAPSTATQDGAALPVGGHLCKVLQASLPETPPRKVTWAAFLSTVFHNVQNKPDLRCEQNHCQTAAISARGN